MPDDQTDEQYLAQVRAEADAIMSGGGGDAPATNQREVPAAPPVAAAAAPPPAAVETPPAATPPAAAPPAQWTPDENTSRAIAARRRAQQEAQAEIAKLEAMRQQSASAFEAEKRLAQLQALAKTGKAGEVLRTLGITPGKEHAEDAFAAALGDDAPEALRLKVELQRMQRRVDEERAEREALKKEIDGRYEREAQERQAVNERTYVRQTLVPQIGEKASILRVLVAHPEFGDSLVNTGIQRFRSMQQELGEADPAEAFHDVDRNLEKMLVAAMSDDAVAKRITALLESKKPKQTIPAEKREPAPTLSNKHEAGSTPPAADDWDAYLKKVREEADALYFKPRQ